MSTATLNGQAVEFIPAHRPGFVTTPVVATATVSIEFDREDLLSALYAWHGMAFSELENDEHARWLIVEAAVNMGLSTLDNLRLEIEELPAEDTDRQEWLAFCRRRVTELFPVAPAPRRRQVRRAVKTTTATRELVTA